MLDPRWRFQYTFRILQQQRLIQHYQKHIGPTFNVGPNNNMDLHKYKTQKLQNIHNFLGILSLDPYLIYGHAMLKDDKTISYINDSWAQVTQMVTSEKVWWIIASQEFVAANVVFCGCVLNVHNKYTWYDI